MRPPQPFADRDATAAAFAAHVNPGKVRAFRELGGALVMGERRGARFTDAFGAGDFWNCHANGGVFNLGHRHPAILAALRAALESEDIGNHHLVSGVRAELARRLARTTGGALPGAVFGVSGGEAVDLAFKLARGATGRRGIVSARGGYHGHTGLALAAGDPAFRDPFAGDLPGFVQVPWNDEAALDAAITRDTAAVILETIPATLGMPLPRPGYLARAGALCRERGALLILDEVQTGLGRTGTIWAYEQEGVVPDLLVTAKGLSGGLYPISATLIRTDLLAFFEERPFAHISTFGGAELGCRVALAVLDAIEAPGFLERVRTLGERFEAGLAGLGELRRRGLFMGLARGRPGAGIEATKRLAAAGVLAVYAAHDTSVVQILPPLTLEDAEADEIIARIRSALS